MITVFVSSFVVVTAMYSMLMTANAPCHNITNGYNIETAVSTHQWQRGNADVDAFCNRDSQQINWVTWLFQRPQSAQFHFVDLLELLNR
jgi:hypothetical protein